MFPQVGSYYEHYKGNIYKIINTPKNADGEEVVAPGIVNPVWYQSVKKEYVWVRSLEEFNGYNLDGKPRFVLIVKV